MSKIRCQRCSRQLLRATQQEVLLGGHYYCRRCADEYVNGLEQRVSEVDKVASTLKRDCSQKSILAALRAVLQNAQSPDCEHCHGAGEYDTMDGEGHSYHYTCTRCCGSGKVVTEDLVESTDI